jgi:hypothetical protein
MPARIASDLRIGTVPNAGADCGSSIVAANARPTASSTISCVPVSPRPRSRRQLARSDERPVLAARVLDVPLAVVAEEESSVPPRDGLGRVALDEDRGGGVTTDRGID